MKLIIQIALQNLLQSLVIILGQTWLMMLMSYKRMLYTKKSKMEELTDKNLVFRLRGDIVRDVISSK